MVDPKALLLNHPLYTEIVVERDIDVFDFEFIQETLDSFCIQCNQESVFESKVVMPQIIATGGPPSWFEPESVEQLKEESRKILVPSHLQQFIREETANTNDYLSIPRPAILEFECTRDRDHKLFFFLNIHGTKVVKTGQLPSISDLSGNAQKKYSKILGEEQLSDLRKSIISASHGYCICAFVYLRRVFEKLVNSAFSRALEGGAIESEEEFNKSRMNDKIRLLSGFLPLFLVENREVYSILSKGIHELTEKECKQYLDAVKTGVEMMLTERLEEENKKKSLEGARRAIKKASSELGKP